MPIKVFAIPCFDDGAAADALNAFVAASRIVSIERHIIADGQNSFWAVCVNYLQPGGGVRAASGRREKLDYREVLPEAEFAVYAKLRALRKQLAETEGVPAYALFTNEQLAAMVQRRIASVEALRGIPGVGEARAEKYAGAFLDVLRAELPALGSGPPEPADEA
jgi:superfamily II DNA helicase RecQ